MTMAVSAVREAAALPVGVNVLRNDGRAALAIALATGAGFIRVNVLSGARLTDQGIVTGIAPELMRERVALGAEGVRVLADIRVKHSAALAPYGLTEEVEDTLERAGADGVVVSGSGTGRPVDGVELESVRAAAADSLVWIGSGVT